MTEVRRGKMPMRGEDVEDLEGGGEGGEGIQMERRDEAEREEEGRRTWTALDAYAFSREGEGETGVTAHVATDDKQVLERLRGMRGAPGQGPEVHAVGEAPREEDVFGVEVERGQEAHAVGSSQAFPPPPDSQTRVLPRESESALPSPPAKAGVGPVARYGETDLSLPRYLDGGRVSPVGPSAPPDEEVGSYGPSAPPEELGPSAPPEELGPSAPPEEIVPSAPLEEIIPSAPPLDDGDDGDDVPGPSAAGESDLLKPSAVSFEDNESGRTLVIPHLRRADSSSPLLEDERL
ncbi:hypothetical protein FRC12_019907 [Ceratobasidium sp. 428]|nr:hypothetical protein FRC12_019907 [Ceratobasidium sp. 428]